MDSTMNELLGNGLLGSGGQGLQAGSNVLPSQLPGLLGNGQPPQTPSGASAPGGASAPSGTNMSQFAPSMLQQGAIPVAGIPQAAQLASNPQATSAPTGLFSGLNPVAGMVGGATPAATTTAARSAPLNTQQMQAGLNLMQMGMPHTIAAPNVPQTGGGGMGQQQALSGLMSSLRNLYGGGMGNGTA